MAKIKPLPRAKNQDDWEEQCATIYVAAWIEIETLAADHTDEKKAQFDKRLAELNIPLDETIFNFRSLTSQTNDAFIPTTQKMLDCLHGGIPFELRLTIADQIADHQECTKREHEIEPRMIEARDEFFKQAKAILTEGGDPGMAKKASSTYLELFYERQQEAKNHIAVIYHEIVRSPHGAVEWCRKLTDFTRKEAALSDETRANLIARLLWLTEGAPEIISDWDRNNYLPGMIDHARTVMRHTIDYIKTDMPFIDTKQSDTKYRLSVERDAVRDSAAEYVRLNLKTFIAYNPAGTAGIMLYQPQY